MVCHQSVRLSCSWVEGEGKEDYKLRELYLGQIIQRDGIEYNGIEYDRVRP